MFGDPAVCSDLAGCPGILFWMVTGMKRRSEVERRIQATSQLAVDL